MAVQKIKRREVSEGKIWSECRKKCRYESEMEAQHVIQARQEDGARDLRYYECRFCNGFHITKQKAYR